MDDLILQVNHLSKSFGTHEVLRDIDFTVKKGDVTSIICWRPLPPAKSSTMAKMWWAGA